MKEKDYGHWHLEYFCDETDFHTMATGFWHEDEETWEVYFNDKKIDELAESLDLPVDESFGILIFHAESFDEAHLQFMEWVENVLLPFKSRNE